MTAASFLPVDEQLELLSRGAVDLVEREGLTEKLARSRKTGQPLVVKTGFDPSSPDLHLGHTVLLRKMRHFQELGHRVVFLVGDFTALIGDPTGKKTTRPQLSPEEVADNARTYLEQVYKVLDRERTAVDRNSRWLLELGSLGIVRLAGRYTLARLMEREDFRSRFAEGKPIHVHELLYPLVQGYDSVAMRCDVELGGHDQIFNLLVGRDLMREEGLEPQVCLTVPLLVGLDGSDKMSKSLGNAIALEDPPREMYGKTMSIPDDLMWEWLLLLTDVPEEEIAARRERVATGELHPKAVKGELASRIVTDFWGEEAAREAAREFERVFASGGLPDELPEVRLPGGATVLDAVLAAGFATSKNEVRRLVGQGGVRLDDEPVAAWDHALAAGASCVLRVGKRRFARLVVGDG